MQPIKKITEGIYCGNYSLFTDLDLKLYNISAIITIISIIPKNEDDEQRDYGQNFVTYNFSFANQELLDSEIPRFISKIAPAVDIIHTLRAAGHNVLVCCEDGKNLSATIIGCYLVSNTPAKVVINLLETMYFSPAQCLEHDIDTRRIIAESDPDEPPPVRTDEENAAIFRGRNERRELCAMRNKSFQKVISIYKK